MSTSTPHKAGFVNIIGNPNVGKSTLMNALVGENLSIITSKVQTTRHRILGIVNGDDFQIVYSDTPGIIRHPGYKLQEAMMRFVDTAIEDADVFIFLTTLDDTEVHPEIMEKLNKSNVPLLLIINKIDLNKQDDVRVKIEALKLSYPKATLLPISALHKFNLEGVLNFILDHLPENEPFYPKDELTDKTTRFFVSEIIREKILLNFQKEIPYSVEVEVDAYKETEDRVEIMAYIYVMRESQKGIILGKQGQAIKRLGIDSRKDIEEFIGKHIYLDLSVKVKKDWREDDNSLKKFGYSS
jgi:GTP-binding protein Era